MSDEHLPEIVAALAREMPSVLRWCGAVAKQLRRHNVSVEGKTSGSSMTDALTLADLSMGTPDYASPEQMEASEDIDWRSDIYSLGVVMYQMLTGKLPRGAYPMPSEIHDEMDTRLDEVVLKAM